MKIATKCLLEQEEKRDYKTEKNVTQTRKATPTS